MKKIKKIIFILFLFPFVLRADFLESLQNIDLLLQKGKYQEALAQGRELSKTEISDEDRKALQNLLSKIEEKIKKENTNTNTSSEGVYNNTGEINFTTDEEKTEDLESVSNGTVAYPGDEINDASRYAEFDRLEKETLASKNSENIHSLIRIYMKSGLYERAMKLGMKDSDVRNIYYSALSARLIGKYDIAIKQYQRVLSKSPNHLNSLLGLALSYRAKKDNSHATKYFKAYINHGGNNQNVLNAMQNLSK